MKRNPIQSTLFILLLALAGAIFPRLAAAATDTLVATEWLASHLHDKDLVIIDVRSESNYGVGHLPGSVNLSYTSWKPYNEIRQCQLMPTPDVFTKMMRAMGVNRASHVIIYDQGNSISDASKGGTALWVLRAMGHPHVSYLDGGFTKWTFEGREIDNVKPVAAEGDFTAAFDASKAANIDDVKNSLKEKKVVFVDARTPDQHFGVEKRADVKRYGHIPGSFCLPVDYLTNAGVNRAPATIKNSELLEQIIKGAGLPADKNQEIIVYCNTCQFAGLEYLILQEILGYQKVRVYDGSMLEYAAREDLPLVKFGWGQVIR